MNNKKRILGVIMIICALILSYRAFIPSNESSELSKQDLYMLDEFQYSFKDPSSIRVYGDIEKYSHIDKDGAIDTMFTIRCSAKNSFGAYGDVKEYEVYTYGSKGSCIVVEVNPENIHVTRINKSVYIQYYRCLKEGTLDKNEEFEKNNIVENLTREDLPNDFEWEFVK